MVSEGALAPLLHPILTLTPESRVSRGIEMTDFRPDRHVGSRVMGDVEVDTWCFGVDLVEVRVEEE